MYNFILHVFRSVGTAQRFPRDWYAYATNQISHVGIGILWVWIVCLVSFAVVGDLPYRSEIFVGVALIYLAKELVIDRWSGFDTVEDFLFLVVYGAGGTLVSFRQIDALSSDVVFNIHSALPFLFTCGLHLLAGSYFRWKAARNE